MSDLFDDPAPGQNDPEFTVTELSNAIKRVIEGEFGHVRIRGEIGRVSRPRSGHVYLDLKDDKSVVNGIIWKGVANRLSIQPEEGMEVVATGRLTTFGGQSRYQIVIEDMKPAGMGALMAMLERRKAALAAEGLFDPARKKPLPYLPEIIGVVTSPSGAVIRDILHRLRDRFPRKVLIWPVAVQGDRCAPEVARAIAGFNALTPGGAMPRPDLLIVARGGGSVEDLWGFNEEIVARAAAASAIPLISAVGHETDTTLIDFVSDKRAPTPTAAAELAVPVRLELLGWTDTQGARLMRAAGQAITARRQRLADLSRAMPRPESLLDGPRQKLDRLDDRLGNALSRGVQTRRMRLAEQAGPLKPSLLQRKLASDGERLARVAARPLPLLGRVVGESRRDLDRASARLTPRPLLAQLDRRRERLAALLRRLDGAGTGQVERLRARLDATERLRETLGYKATLARGYAVIRAEGQVVTSKAEAEGKPGLQIEFSDGMIETGAVSATVAPRPAKPRKKTATKPEQGSLF